MRAGGGGATGTPLTAGTGVCDRGVLARTPARLAGVAQDVGTGLGKGADDLRDGWSALLAPATAPALYLFGGSLAPPSPLGWLSSGAAATAVALEA